MAASPRHPAWVELSVATVQVPSHSDGGWAAAGPAPTTKLAAARTVHPMTAAVRRIVVDLIAVPPAIGERHDAFVQARGRTHRRAANGWPARRSRARSGAAARRQRTTTVRSPC